MDQTFTFTSKGTIVRVSLSVYDYDADSYTLHLARDNSLSTAFSVREWQIITGIIETFTFFLMPLPERTQCQQRSGPRPPEKP